MSMIDVPECAEMLGTSERHVRSLIEHRRIPYYKVGRLVRFDRGELEHWLAANYVPAESHWTAPDPEEVADFMVDNDGPWSDLVAESRAAQGLPRHVEDPAALARAVDLVQPHDDHDRPVA